MKTLLTIICLLLLLPAVRTEAEDRLNRAESFTAFWTRFKSAVAKNEQEVVAAMTKLPHFSRAELIRSIFNRAVQKCFAAAKPVKETDRDSYSVICGEEIFVFEKVDGSYKLTDIGMND